MRDPAPALIPPVLPKLAPRPSEAVRRLMASRLPMLDRFLAELAAARDQAELAALRARAVEQLSGYDLDRFLEALSAVGWSQS